MSRRINSVTRYFVFIALVLAATSGSLMAQQAVPTGWADFTKMFDTAMETDRVTGAGIMVMRDGDLVSRHEYGFADRANNKRVTDRTIFHYGSITKTLTAVAVMQLRDRGRLTLDDKVTRYIPELRMVHDPYHAIDKITIRMLLSHSAGSRIRPGHTRKAKTGSLLSPPRGTNWWP